MLTERAIHSRYATPTDIQAAYALIKRLAFTKPFNVKQSTGLLGQAQFVVFDRHGEPVRTGTGRSDKRIMFDTDKRAKKFIKQAKGLRWSGLREGDLSSRLGELIEGSRDYPKIRALLHKHKADWGEFETAAWDAIKDGARLAPGEKGADRATAHDEAIDRGLGVLGELVGKRAAQLKKYAGEMEEFASDMDRDGGH